MTRRRKLNSNQSLSTADYLAQAVFRDLLPEHPQTCEDYGFNRAISPEEKCNLLGLYIGLIKLMDIKPKTIHDWRVRGVLVDKIKAAFYKIPEGARGAYFPWFLQNQHIVALAGQPLTAKELRDHGDALLVRSWRFTGGSERHFAEEIRAIIASKPAGDQKCHSLYTLLLSGWTPSPALDLWIDFGFASCMSEAEEEALGGHYQRLITLCTFEEFCDAYRNRRLLDLFHSKGLHLNSNVLLRDLLSSHLPVGARESVWNLKASLLVKDVALDLSTRVDYGFINCQYASELEQLKKVYRAFFRNHGDPLALHDAAVRGSLYDFLSNIVQAARNPIFRRLLENPYPLPNPDIPIWGTAPSYRQVPSFPLTLVVGVGFVGVLLGVLLRQMFG